MEKSCKIVKNINFTHFSAAVTILEQQSALNSGSQVSKKCKSSFIIPRMLLLFTRANDSSIARLKAIGQNS